MTTFTVLFPFAGIGGGALGFLGASANLFGQEARFVSSGAAIKRMERAALLGAAE